MLNDRFLVIISTDDGACHMSGELSLEKAKNFARINHALYVREWDESGNGNRPTSRIYQLYDVFDQRVEGVDRNGGSAA
jgi:hypothetical protein